MSLTTLTQKLTVLNQIEVDLATSEQTAIRLISATRLDLSQDKVESLLTLIESVTPLRQLIHTQLKEMLVDLQTEIISTRTGQVNVSPESSPMPTSSVSSQQSQEAETILLNTPYDDDLSKQESQGSLVESSDDHLISEATPKSHQSEPNDLADLKRDVDFLTSPNFADMGMIPDQIGTVDPSEEPPMFETDLSSPIPEDDSLIQESMTSRFTPPPKKYKSDPNSSFDFPISSGEAGTAIFDIEELKNQSPEITMEKASAKKDFYIHISTPHKAFKGKVTSFDHKLIVVVSEISLLPGEEVRLKFELPQTKQRIDCRALVRSLSNETHGDPCLKIRFLDLRPHEEQMIMEELTRS